jgi:hypothetical protein
MICGWPSFKIMCDISILHPRWLALQLVDISLNGKKKKIGCIFAIEFRCQTENQMNDYKFLEASSF